MESAVTWEIGIEKFASQDQCMPSVLKSLEYEANYAMLDSK